MFTKLRNAQGKGQRATARAVERLHTATRPVYQSLFQQITQTMGGMRFLVGMRADLLVCAADIVCLSCDVQRQEQSVFSDLCLRDSCTQLTTRLVYCLPEGDPDAAERGVAGPLAGHGRGAATHAGGLVQCRIPRPAAHLLGLACVLSRAGVASLPH